MPKRSTAERWWSSSGEVLPIATYLSMDITVILCTYNRSESLAKALASVAVQEMSPGVLWEVLVIDNNSRDETPSVVRRFSEKYPGAISVSLRAAAWQVVRSQCRNSGGPGQYPGVP